MKIKQVVFGDIRECLNNHILSLFNNNEGFEYEYFGFNKMDSRIYKENAILLELEEGGYIDLEVINSILDCIKVNIDIMANVYRVGGLRMDDSCWFEGQLFVDPRSIKPYYDNNKENENISIKRLKKQLTKTK